MNYLTTSTIWPFMLFRGHSTGQKYWAICPESQVLYFILYRLHINLVRPFTRFCLLSILSIVPIRSLQIVPENAKMVHLVQHIQIAAIWPLFLHLMKMQECYMLTAGRCSASCTAVAQSNGISVAVNAACTNFIAACCPVVADSGREV